VHDGESVTAVFADGPPVQVITSRGAYHADYLVAADGAQGPVARQVGFPRPRHGAAIECELEVNGALWDRYAGRVEIHVGAFPWGYAWIIPRAGILNIGVGSFRPHKFPLKHSFLDFVEKITGTRAVNALAHPLPYRLRFVRPVVGQVLFVGDAAGYMDAFSAEGIYSALRSGILAAEAIVAHADQKAPLQRYSDQLFLEFWPSLRAAIKTGLLFYPLPAFWSKFFSHNSSLLSDYLDVAMGIMPYAVLQKHTEQALLSQRPTLIPWGRAKDEP
jgi:flavin-dependent dehydrogenase